ncbi:phosphodiesterase [Candidatus Contubernalis alkaliaceticus]|uniref:phosphodiesterase n=1 Tax=Candidatus Contubernalis alkaliaceticus TaxID=338645 RepID=UPI001F4BFA49|nr:phosphodiesterase [Candidatus Contubernalis alkalaceticus]UNC92373.1 phosphodiesterase [Candidatus Contubernalis alkalaceticus]
MKIGVISDTHGSLDAWNKAMEHFAGCQFILHAGDVLYHGPRNPLPQGYDPKELAAALNNSPIPVFVVRGNCDAEVEEVMLEVPIMSPYFFCSLEGLQILMLHGTNCSEEQLSELGNKYNADILVFGHIHTPTANLSGNTILFNPGSPSISFHTEPTVGIIDTEEKKARIITLDKGEPFKEISF